MNDRQSVYANAIDDSRKVPFFDDSIIPANSRDRSFPLCNSQEGPFNSSYNPNFYRMPAPSSQHSMPGFSDKNLPFHNNRQTMDDMIISTNRLGLWNANYRNPNLVQPAPLVDPSPFPPNFIGFPAPLPPFPIHSRPTGGNSITFTPDANLTTSNELATTSPTTNIDSDSFYNFREPLSNYTLPNSNNGNNSSSNNYNSSENIGNQCVHSPNETDNSAASQTTTDIFTNSNPGITTPKFAPFEPNYFDINPESFSKTPLDKLTNTCASNNSYEASLSVLSTPNLSSNKHSRFFPSPKSERVRPYGSISAIQNGGNPFHSLDNTPTSSIPNLTDKITFLNLSSNVFPSLETMSPSRDTSAFPINDDSLIPLNTNPINTQPLSNSQQNSVSQSFLSYDSSFSIPEKGSHDPFGSFFHGNAISKLLNSDQETYRLSNSTKSANDYHDSLSQGAEIKSKNTSAPQSEKLSKPSISSGGCSELLPACLVPRGNSLEDLIKCADKENQKLKHDNNNNVKDTLVSLCAFNLNEDKESNINTENTEIEEPNNIELPVFEKYAYSYPEGFSSTFYKRVDNNFMFVREIQSKSTVLKFRSNSVLELRLSIPSLPLFEAPEEVKKEDKRCFTIDTNKKSIPKKKKYKSFVVQMNLHDLEGRISGLKVSKQQQMNSKISVSGDTKCFDSEGKTLRNSHPPRNDRKYQGSKPYYKKPYNSEYKKKRKSAVQVS